MTYSSLNEIKSGIITGAGNGIGFSSTENLLKKNYRVHAITRSKSKKLELLKNKYEYLEIYYQDLSILDKSKNLVKKIMKKDKKIMFLVNNAGNRKRKSFLELSIREFKEIMQNNFFSQVNITQEYIKNRNTNKDNFHKILFITSIVGPRGFKNLSSYASSKSALESLSKNLSVEFSGKNIYFNSIAPGFVNTSYANNFKSTKKEIHKWTISKTPLKRWGEPNEISEVIAFLISNKSSFINGSVIFADGGWTAE